MILTVFITIGLPGSGKSAWAKQFVSEHPDTIIVSRDNIREMIYGEYAYYRERESVVKGLQFAMIKDALYTHKRSVIVDGTHITRKHREEIIEAVKEFKESNVDVIKPEFRYVVCHETERNVAFRMEADKGASRERWEGVVDGMMKAFEPPDNYELEAFEIAGVIDYVIPDDAVPKVSVSVPGGWRVDDPTESEYCLVKLTNPHNDCPYDIDLAHQTGERWGKRYNHEVAAWIPLSEIKYVTPEGVVSKTGGYLVRHWRSGSPDPGVYCLVRVNRPLGAQYGFDEIVSDDLRKYGWKLHHTHEITGWIPVSELG